MLKLKIWRLRLSNFLRIRIYRLVKKKGRVQTKQGANCAGEDEVVEIREWGMMLKMGRPGDNIRDRTGYP
ncbi:hypothetical protein [Olivibacter domesticus]|uniref:hypothetical protein n=1 Tax=Olivibacter domesticus TaxID=407022 RepID=UPI000B878BAA|nr:hypothetical protein [Olivibacter domesticus]